MRALNGVAAHVQTLTIPVLAGPRPRVRARAAGMLAALRRGKAPQDDAPDGCDPTVFASQCAEYLERAAAERAASATADRRHEPADGDLSSVPMMIEPPSVGVIDEFEANLAESRPDRRIGRTGARAHRQFHDVDARPDRDAPRAASQFLDGGGRGT